MINSNFSNNMFPPHTSAGHHEKRVLRGASKIYEPLSFLTPVTIRAKILKCKDFEKLVTAGTNLCYDNYKRNGTI